MIARALRKIEARLLELLTEPKAIDPHELRVIAMQIAAQAEMLELDLPDEVTP